MGSLLELRDKLRRANQHIDDLKRFLPGRELAIEEGKLATVELQPDGKTHDLIFSRVTPSLDLRMAIGDVIHDLRTTLDHLVYQLALRAGFAAIGRTESQRRELRKLQFVIAEDSHRFESAAGNVRKLVGHAPVEAMRRLQKYKGVDRRGQILWQLSELDNISKHRVIVAVNPEFRRANVTFRYEGQATTRTITQPAWNAIKDRAKLMSFNIHTSLEPHKLDVDVKTVQEIVLPTLRGCATETMSSRSCESRLKQSPVSLTTSKSTFSPDSNGMASCPHVPYRMRLAAAARSAALARETRRT